MVDGRRVSGYNETYWREHWVKNTILIREDAVSISILLYQMHSLTSGAEILCVSFALSASRSGTILEAYIFPHRWPTSALYSSFVESLTAVESLTTIMDGWISGLVSRPRSDQLKNEDSGSRTGQGFFFTSSNLKFIVETLLRRSLCHVIHLL